MREHYTFLTPENVELRYEVAGIGSRLIAAMLDYLLISLAEIMLLIGMAGLGPVVVATLRGLMDRATAEAAGTWIMAGLVIVLFLAWWGYFVIFELVWNGQTPGKRLAGLRVLRENGQPVGVVASLARNLLRAVDGFLFLGIIVMFMDRSSRRLGDFAAGTMVVREPRRLSERAFTGITIPEVPAMVVQSLPNPGRLTRSHYALVRDYFGRRGRLRSDEAQRIARQLADELRRVLEAEGAQPADSEWFLATVARAFEDRQRYRDTSDAGS